MSGENSSPKIHNLNPFILNAHSNWGKFHKPSNMIFFF